MRAETVAAALLSAFSVGLVYGGWSALYGHNQAADAVGWSSPGPAPSSPASTGRTAERPVSAQAGREPDGTVVISGVITGASAGDPIVVQRTESGAWTDFPARTTTGPHGGYTVRVQTARTTGRFRVRDERTGFDSAQLQLPSRRS
jgi:hypothetical protein